MTGYGEAVAFGAATIVNAIATGKGAAFGIDLRTFARVELTSDIGIIEGKILSEPSEKTILIEKAVQTVFSHFGEQMRHGAKVETDSNIPIAKGLKSSSVAANAIILATTAALGRKINDELVLKLSVDAAFRAKTTISGAFDDVCASFYGKVVVTDNLRRLILRKEKIKDNYSVLICLPRKKVYTAEVEVEKMKLLSPQIELAFEEALKRNYWKALTLNGILYSSVLGYDFKPVFDALEGGAVAAGISGKGPAIVAVAKEEDCENIIGSWKTRNNDILRVGINREKSYIIRRE